MDDRDSVQRQYLRIGFSVSGVGSGLTFRYLNRKSGGVAILVVLIGLLYGQLCYRGRWSLTTARSHLPDSPPELQRGTVASAILCSVKYEKRAFRLDIHRYLKTLIVIWCRRPGSNRYALAGAGF